MMKNFTKILCFVVAMFSLTAVYAQQGYEKNNEIFRLGVEARFDYLNEAVSGVQNDAASGFKVRYLNIRMDGQHEQKYLKRRWRKSPAGNSWCQRRRNPCVRRLLQRYSYAGKCKKCFCGGRGTR